MSGMEFNKLMAAILVAGIVACFAGFISRETVHARELEEAAVPIEVAAAGGAAGAAEKPAGPEPILAMLASADIAKGEKVAKACAACHDFTKGGPNRTGPNLWGVVGRAKGTEAGFSYSDGMKGKGGVWNYDDLNHFLWKPKAFVSGTKMTFIGLKKAEDRAAVIAWLRTLSDSPAALPSEADIKKEGPAEDEAGETPAEE